MSDFYGDYGSTHRKAIDGDRTSSIEMYKKFINEFEKTGKVSDEGLDHAYQVFKKIIHVEELIVDKKIERRRRSDSLMRALNLSGRARSMQSYRAEIIYIPWLFSPLNYWLTSPLKDEKEAKKDRTERIIEILKKSKYALRDDLEKFEISPIISNAKNIV